MAWWVSIPQSLPPPPHIPQSLPPPRPLPTPSPPHIPQLPTPPHIPQSKRKQTSPPPQEDAEKQETSSALTVEEAVNVVQAGALVAGAFALGAAVGTVLGSSLVSRLARADEDHLDEGGDRQDNAEDDYNNREDKQRRSPSSKKQKH